MSKDELAFKFGLGDEVRHSITGYKGIIYNRTEWFNGCIRYGIMPSRTTKEGKIGDVETLDEGELVLIKRAKVKPQTVASGAPGGPFPAAVRSRQVRDRR